MKKFKRTIVKFIIFAVVIALAFIIMRNNNGSVDVENPSSGYSEDDSENASRSDEEIDEDFAQAWKNFKESLVDAYNEVESMYREAESSEDEKKTDSATSSSSTTSSSYVNLTADSFADYSGDIYIEFNNNTPLFTASEITTYSTQYGYEYYSDLDSLERCGYAMALVGKETMPSDDRESISSVKPSGWKQNKYDTSLVDGGYLYNRAHLIAFCLCGENANELNLITGTRYFNVNGMLPFEEKVLEYVKTSKDNHVLYRVTPYFDGTDLLAKGVLMEAYSIEDDSIRFCVFVYNVQPGINIDYSSGNNWVGE